MQNAAIAALGLHFCYIPFSVQPDDIGPAIHSLRTLGIVGVNLTIPHKERVLQHLDVVAPDARAIGAVNTVHNEGGRLTGYNTDGEGFLAPLLAEGFAPRGKTAVILGAGGAARSVVWRLAGEGARIILANRTGERAKRLADEANRALGLSSISSISLGDAAGLVSALDGADLLVNTTSVGMYPHVEEEPAAPRSALHPNLTVYDLVYNPVETRLLTFAREAGARTINGVKMLVHQGAAALRIWTGANPPIAVMEQAVIRALGGGCQTSELRSERISGED